MTTSSLPRGVLPTAADLPSKDELLRQYESAMFRAGDSMRRASDGMADADWFNWQLDYVEKQLTLAGNALIDARSAVAALNQLNDADVDLAVELVTPSEDPFLPSRMNGHSKGGA